METRSQQEVENLTLYTAFYLVGMIVAPEDGAAELSEEKQRIFGYI
jgi:hypothetical protein